MQEHSCCSVDIELMQMLVCPKCGYSVSFSPENPSASLPACFNCQIATNALHPDAIGTYPFELEANYNAKDRVSGKLTPSQRAWKKTTFAGKIQR